MSLTTFLVLSVAIAASVGLLASLLLRAWLQKPEKDELAKTLLPDGQRPSLGQGQDQGQGQGSGDLT